eukprot:525949-Rhodomonas_salina.1
MAATIRPPGADRRLLSGQNSTQQLGGRLHHERHHSKGWMYAPGHTGSCDAGLFNRDANGYGSNSDPSD